MTRLRKSDPNAFLSPAKSPEAFAADVAELRRVLQYDAETGIFSWRVTARGHVRAGVACGQRSHTGYIFINLKRRCFLAHRLAWVFLTGTWPSGQIDHVNGRRDDNKAANLRDVSNVVNMQNQQRANARNQSGFLGVGYSPSRKSSNKFRAVICIPGCRSKFLGWFGRPEAAHAAYLAAKRRLHEGCTL